MHIILLSYYYPPDPEVGAVRPARLVQALRGAGHSVTVITACVPGERPGVRLAQEREVVVAVPSPVPLRLVLARIKARKRRMGGGGAPASDAGLGLGPTRSMRSQLKRWLLSAVWTPDDRQRFIRHAVRAARRVHRRRPADLLYSTAPPFSVHLAASVIAARLKLPWVAEFRDPWTDTPRGPATRSRASDWVESRLERTVLGEANLVVAVTPTVGGWLAAKRERMGKPDGVIVALNGIAGSPPPGPLSTEQIEILHAGTLYLKRNPRLFLAAMAEAVRSGAFGGRDLRVTFLGAQGDAYEGVPVVQMAQELGLGDNVQFEGHLPIEACRERMARATGLLLLAQDQPAQVPNKLYDYLSARRPIIALADPGGESASLLQGVGGHFIIDPADPGSHEAIIDAVRQCTTRGSDYWAANSMLDELSTEAQLTRVVRGVESVAAMGKPR